MTRLSTNMDFQRATFVESLYASLKKQASKVVQDQEKFIILASSYLSDGLEESECVELLMIDGLERDTAESYTALAMSNEVRPETALNEYSFQFEDAYGKLYTSFDIGKTVKAANEEDARIKTEEIIYNEQDIEPGQIISVTRIS